MKARLVSLLLLAPAFAVAAEALDPGEWEIVSTTSSPSLSKPQTETTKRCIGKDEAADALRWLTESEAPGDCTLSTVKKEDVYAVRMSCPKRAMEASGSARYRKDRFETEMTAKTRVNNQAIEIVTKTAGRRLGECKGKS